MEQGKVERPRSSKEMNSIEDKFIGCVYSME